MAQKNRHAFGACLCGDIRFQVSVPGIVINNCHCSRCRKATGSSHGTYFHTTTSRFKWSSGEDLIKTFIPKNGDARAFCTKCGSLVPTVDRDEDHVIIPAGLLEDDVGLKISVNIYEASKPSWNNDLGDVPAFQEDAPDSFWEEKMKEFSQSIVD